MDDGRDIFASLMGTAKPATPVVKPGRVTTATIAKVREAQAVEAAERAFDEKLEAVKAEKEALEAKVSSLQEEIATLNIAIASIAADKASLQDQLDQASGELKAARAAGEDFEEAAKSLRSENGKLSAANSELNLELAALKAEPKVDPSVAAESEERLREIERLKALLNEAQRTSLSSSVLLEKPYAFAEKFPGEIREHVLDTILEAQKAADGDGRERRAKLLEAILMANPSDGELERRREAVKSILLGVSGGFIGERDIKELERLGFRSVGTGPHRKLVWGNVPFTVETPPDGSRSILNSEQTLKRAF